MRLTKALVASLDVKTGDELAVVEADKGLIMATKAERRRSAIDRLGALHWQLPADDAFERDRANTRRD